MLSQESGRKKILVLISDGESDLGGSVTGRELEMSEDDLAFAAEACHNADIPVYTIDFGKIDGSMQVLETISQRSYFMEKTLLQYKKWNENGYSNCTESDTLMFKVESREYYEVGSGVMYRNAQLYIDLIVSLELAENLLRRHMYGIRFYPVRRRSGDGTL